ncbi:CybS-domain-containing protein [Kickxella alabastrina]|uniref:CybS-domain-containing protein n=1 Tax=Kickxella alabastrina TaxID=61397 RepID=UPI00222030A1|nr:CybS-domain-containing protein [Kickxella alabastrina]KAI7832167.1 CybS-domain-containing protein [Kickxella alabastrina]KAJ1946527.1 membrane anchor subunit of succinate dehydrogenase, Sdh4 [Kickxella alabastrina]
MSFNVIAKRTISSSLVSASLAHRSAPMVGTISHQLQQRMTLRTAQPLLFKATTPKALFGDEVPNPAAVPQPPANRMHGSYHWMNERAISVISVPLLATAFIYGSHPINDMLMGIVLPMQAYMEFDQMLLDYFQARRWPVISRVLKYALVTITGLAMFGAWRINTTDVGLTNYFSRIWNANNKKEERSD